MCVTLKWPYILLWWHILLCFSVHHKLLVQSSNWSNERSRWFTRRRSPRKVSKTKKTFRISSTVSSASPISYTLSLLLLWYHYSGMLAICRYVLCLLSPAYWMLQNGVHAGCWVSSVWFLLISSCMLTQGLDVIQIAQTRTTLDISKMFKIAFLVHLMHL